MNKHPLHKHTSGQPLGRAFLSAVLFAFLASSVQAVEFILASEEGGRQYGPFEFKDGEKVVIEKTTFVVKKLKTSVDLVDLETTLKSLIIPEMDFRQATMRDVVEFLQQQSIELSKASSKKNRAPRIILNTNGTSVAKLPLVSFSAQNLSLLQAIELLANVTGLKYRFEESSVFIEAKTE